MAHSLRAEGFDAGEDGTGCGVPLVCGALSDGAHMGGGSTARTPTPDESSPFPPVALALQERDAKGADSSTKPGHLIPVGGGFDAPIPFDTGQTTIAFHNRQDPDISGDVTHPLGARDNGMGIGIDCYNGQITGGVAATMGTPGSSVNASGPTVMAAMQVRRLTPRECERLQGFPDDYTLIQVRGKPAADGPRYRALGNSMAVNVMRWIGDRIQSVADIQ